MEPGRDTRAYAKNPEAPCSTCLLLLMWQRQQVVPVVPLRLLFLMVLLRFPSPTTAADISAVIVFGDSTADPGNNNYIPTIGRADFPPYGRDFFGGQPTGRFCNGRLATDFISEGLGLPPAIPAYLDPGYGIQDFATGVSFASAGTGLDDATANIINVLSIGDQLNLYREYQHRLRQNFSAEDAESTISKALYFISIATNDFIENYYVIPGRASEFTVVQYQDFLIGITCRFIEDIYHLGARNVALTGLSPFGCLPLVRTGVEFNGGGGLECREDYNKVAREYNGKLRKLVEKLNGKHRDLTLVIVEVYHLFEDVVGRPKHYGFEDYKTGCCGTGLFEMSYACNKWNPLTCPDATKYVFWDAIHPSEAMYRVVAHTALDTSLSVFK